MSEQQTSNPVDPQIAEARAALRMWFDGRWRPQYAADQFAKIIGDLLDRFSDETKAPSECEFPGCHGEHDTDSVHCKATCFVQGETKRCEREPNHGGEHIVQRRNTTPFRWYSPEKTSPSQDGRLEPEPSGDAGLGTAGREPSSVQPSADKCEHGIPRRFCTAVHEPKCLVAACPEPTADGHAMCAEHMKGIEP